MKEILRETESLCPSCLRKIPAWIVAENSKVYLEKSCPQHGDYKVIIWREDGNHYLKWAEFAGGRTPKGPQKRLTEHNRGCPYDCGICPEHQQDTCAAVLLTTNRCNLHCPDCFVSGNEGAVYKPDFDIIKRMYQLVLDTCGTYPIQLCGGEPTTRGDLPQVVALGKAMGFDYIQINTNGTRIAKDKEYLSSLKAAGATTIYLSFDGEIDEGQPNNSSENLHNLRVQAVSNCAEVKIGVILVPTIIANTNLHKIGDMIQFAKRWMPTVKGFSFQPISYVGRYSRPPNDEDRVTIPDILRALEEQTQGELKREDFVPPMSEEAHCSFSGFAVLKENGRLMPTTHFQPRVTNEDGAEHSRQFVKRCWTFTEESEELPYPSYQDEKTASRFLKRSKTEYLSIGGMAFQDVWNIDLERLRKCCIHILSPTEKMIPLCAKYVTSIDGKRLYPESFLMRG